MARLLRLGKWTNRLAWSVWSIRKKNKTRSIAQDSDGQPWVDSNAWIDSDLWVD